MYITCLVIMYVFKHGNMINAYACKVEVIVIIFIRDIYKGKHVYIYNIYQNV